MANGRGAFAVAQCSTVYANRNRQPQRARWDFYRVFESIEEGEYGLLGCERVSDTVGELRIDTYSYPYGGVGALIALAEAFRFEVLGVNECGKYESRTELLG